MATVTPMVYPAMTRPRLVRMSVGRISSFHRVTAVWATVWGGGTRVGFTIPELLTTVYTARTLRMEPALMMGRLCEVTKLDSCCLRGTFDTVPDATANCLLPFL